MTAHGIILVRVSRFHQSRGLGKVCFLLFNSICEMFHARESSFLNIRRKRFAPQTFVWISSAMCEPHVCNMKMKMSMGLKLMHILYVPDELDGYHSSRYIFLSRNIIAASESGNQKWIQAASATFLHHHFGGALRIAVATESEIDDNVARSFRVSEMHVMSKSFEFLIAFERTNECDCETNWIIAVNDKFLLPAQKRNSNGKIKIKRNMANMQQHCNQLRLSFHTCGAVIGLMIVSIVWKLKGTLMDLRRPNIDARVLIVPNNKKKLIIFAVSLRITSKNYPNALLLSFAQATHTWNNVRRSGTLQSTFGR